MIKEELIELKQLHKNGDYNLKRIKRKFLKS